MRSTSEENALDELSKCRLILFTGVSSVLAGVHRILWLFEQKREDVLLRISLAVGLRNLDELCTSGRRDPNTVPVSLQSGASGVAGEIEDHLKRVFDFLNQRLRRVSTYGRE